MVLLSPSQLRYIQVQFRPEFVNPRAVLDSRVRRALAYAIDNPAISRDEESAIRIAVESDTHLCPTLKHSGLEIL